MIMYNFFMHLLPRKHGSVRMIRGGEIQMNKSKTECVLICLSPSPANSSVINAAVKIAGAFNSELKAFFVETPAYDRISEQDKIQLDNNKKLAVKSGAKFSSSYGSDVAMQIAEYAKACNATKIVIGRSNQKKEMGVFKE